MKFFNAVFFSLLLLISSCSSIGERKISSGEIPPFVHQLVKWETGANAVAVRSSEMIEIEHFEIPLEVLEQDISAELDQNIVDSLIFEKDGKKYVRWIINPEDTKWFLEMREFLISKSVDPTPKKYFQAYLTASRSMIIFDPTNNSSFSMKVSTNKTGGNWKDKKQTWDDAKQIRKISDWVKHITEKMKTSRMVIMDEPFAMGAAEIDQGMIMRSLNNVPDGENYYLPGFSALHEEEGKRIAALNGSNNVFEFWNDNYNKPLAEALAELAVYTGVYYDSPHSQNFLIELDKNMKPTGRIVLRDFGDAYLLKDFIENTEYKSILDIWEKDNIVKGKLKTAVGLLHGNSPPSWISNSEYQKYGIDFYKSFEEKFSEISGIPKKDLSKERLFGGNYSYYAKQYSTTSSGWKKYIEYANCFSGKSFNYLGEKCLEIYEKWKKSSPGNCTNAVNDFLTP